MTRNLTDLEASLQQFITRQFPVARQHHVGPQESLVELGIVDSLGVLEIVTFIEQEFGVALSDDELMPEHFESIATICELVGGRLAQEDAA